jgi:hypothetical protein
VTRVAGMQAGLRNGLAGGALPVRIKCDVRQRQAGLRPVRVLAKEQLCKSSGKTFALATWTVEILRFAQNDTPP